jgi:hypothetical protein
LSIRPFAPATLVMVLALALAVRLVNLWLMAGLPVAEYEFHWTEGDMAAHYAWSGRILSGDILSRDTGRPYTSWMARIAPRETWERWWGGKAVLHKAPLYPYVLAGMRLVAGDGFWAIGLCQLALGLVNVWLIFILTDRFFGRSAAAVAGVGAACYGLFLLHETLLLRDSLGVTTSLLLLWGLSRCDEGRFQGWVVAGVLFAVAILAREATLLFGGCVAVWIVQRFWRRWRVLLDALAAFTAGVLLGLLPLFARNVAVGVSPWALSSLPLEAIVLGHSADAFELGFNIPPSAKSTFIRSDGRLGTAVRLTWATYEGDRWRVLDHLGTRAAAVFSRYEVPDNVNWYYFVERSPILRFSLRYEIVLAFGMLGLWLARADAWRHRLLWYFLLAGFAALMCKPPVIGRYRLAPTAVLLIYGGAAGAWFAREIQGRRWRPIIGATVAVVLLGLLSASLLGSHERRMRHRGTEFLLAGEVYYHRHERERALEELRAGLRSAYRGPDQTALPRDFRAVALEFATVARELGRDADAVAELRRLAAELPRDATLTRLLVALDRPSASQP